MTLHDVACWVVWRSVDSLSVVNRRFVGAVVLCQNVLPQRDFRDYGDNGGRKIKKSEEGASSSSSNVDQELVRSFCLFCVIATLSCIRGKLI